MKKSNLVLMAASLATLLGAGMASAQDIYVSDSSTDQISYFTPGGTPDTLSSNLLDDPTGLAFNSSGDLFIANSGNGDIVEYNPSNGNFSTYATGLTDPRGLAFDSAGNLYVANDAPSGLGGGVTEFTYGAGSLSSSPTQYVNPLSGASAITIDGFGDLYVTVSGNMIARIAPGGGAGSTNLFSVPSPNQLNGDNGIAFGSNGDLYVVNTGAQNVEQITLVLNGSTSVANTGTDSNPQGLLFDSNGNLYVADYGTNSVSEYTLETGSNGVYQLSDTYSTGFGGPSFLAEGPGPAVPEPGTYALLLSGLLALYFMQRRRVAAPVKLS